MDLNVENYMIKLKKKIMINDVSEFTCAKEFLENYKYHIKDLPKDSNEEILSKFGIWLKFKEPSQIVSVCAIDDKGLFLTDRFVNWKDLAKYHLFLDGTPCYKDTSKKDIIYDKNSLI